MLPVILFNQFVVIKKKRKHHHKHRDQSSSSSSSSDSSSSSPSSSSSSDSDSSSGKQSKNILATHIVLKYCALWKKIFNAYKIDVKVFDKYQILICKLLQYLEIPLFQKWI